jgi:hypothetical protein
VCQCREDFPPVCCRGYADPMTDAGDSFEAIFDELLAMYPVPYSQIVRKKYIGVKELADGWYLHVHRGCLAILLLEDETFGEETAPLRRSVVEHVIALKWLVEDGESILDPLKRGTSYGLEKLQKGAGQCQLGAP